MAIQGLRVEQGDDDGHFIFDSNFEFEKEIMPGITLSVTQLTVDNAFSFYYEMGNEYKARLLFELGSHSEEKIFTSNKSFSSLHVQITAYVDMLVKNLIDKLNQTTISFSKETKKDLKTLDNYIDPFIDELLEDLAEDDSDIIDYSDRDNWED
jgi:hypothetical protein